MRCDHQIAGQGNGGTASGSQPLNRRDRGDMQVLQAHHHRLEIPLHEIADVRQLAIDGLHGGIGEILSRAEGAPRPAEHQNPQLAIGFNAGHGLMDLNHGRRVEAVEFFRPVQDDASHTAFDREQNVLECHGPSPSGSDRT
ncbi:hypothetical protein D3C72_1681110 [compost metagenome]